MHAAHKNFYVTLQANSKAHLFLGHDLTQAFTITEETLGTLALSCGEQTHDNTFN